MMKQRMACLPVTWVAVAAGIVLVALVPSCGEDIPLGTGNFCIVQLASPQDGATMDNGSRSGTIPMVWDFNWSDCPRASRYHLYVYNVRAVFPLIDCSTLTASSYHHESRGYIIDRNCAGWRWKVRAKVNGAWGPWSAERAFTVLKIGIP